MTITSLAYGLSAVVGAGIIVIGARFLLAPRAAAAVNCAARHQDQAQRQATGPQAPRPTRTRHKTAGRHDAGH
jgi:hypothetical protein